MACQCSEFFGECSDRDSKTNAPKTDTAARFANPLGETPKGSREIQKTGREVVKSGARNVIAGREVHVAGREVVVAGWEVVIAGWEVVIAGARNDVAGRELHVAGARIVVAGWEPHVAGATIGGVTWRRLKPASARAKATIVAWKSAFSWLLESENSPLGGLGFYRGRFQPTAIEAAILRYIKRQGKPRPYWEISRRGYAFDRLPTGTFGSEPLDG